MELTTEPDNSTSMKRKNDCDDTINEENNNRSKILRIENDYDYESIWTKLGQIVEELIGREGPYNDWKMECYDVLFVISSDPDKIKCFDMSYGAKKVANAVKEASKLISTNDNVDPELVDFIWQKRYELVNALNVSYVTEKLKSTDFMAAIIDVANLLHDDSTFNLPNHCRFSFESRAKKYELQLMMAVDPVSFLQKAVSFEIGHSKAIIGISVCTHILERMLKEHPNEKSALFKRKRNNHIKAYAEFVLKKIPNYKEMFKQLRNVVTKYWRDDSDAHIDAFTVLLMMDPKMMYSKCLLFTQAMVSEHSMSEIEDELRNSANQLMVADAKVEKGGVIIAQINLNGASCKFLRKCLGKKVINDSHEPDIIVYEVCHKHIVCSNLKTLDWLKTAVKESTPNASIESWVKLEDDEFRNVVLLSQIRITEPFDYYRQEIKKYNPNLRAELWTCLGPVNDWTLSIRVDVRSILYLESNNRQIRVDKLIYKCFIQYINYKKSK